MGNKNEGLYEDETTEKFAMILHLLIEDILKDVIFQDVCLFNRDSCLQCMVNSLHNCITASTKLNVSLIIRAINISNWLRIINGDFLFT